MPTWCQQSGLDLFSPFSRITVIVLNGRHGELIHIKRISMPLKRSVHFVRRGDVRGDKYCSFPDLVLNFPPAQRHTAPSGLVMEIIYFQLFKQHISKWFIYFVKMWEHQSSSGPLMKWTHLPYIMFYMDFYAWGMKMQMKEMRIILVKKDSCTFNCCKD